MRPIVIAMMILSGLSGAPANGQGVAWQEAGAVVAHERRPEENPQILRLMRELAANFFVDSVVLNTLRRTASDNDSITVESVIDRDIAWRLQAKRGRGPLLDSVMGGVLSRHLTLLRIPWESVLADLMLTDDRGLLLAATRIPSDYDQSDEAKFTALAEGRPGIVHVERASYDESADDYAIMASIVLTDPVDGHRLGVLCANFTLAGLQQEWGDDLL